MISSVKDLESLYLSILYNRYRIKQRLNSELEAKQRQINEKNKDLQKLVQPRQPSGTDHPGDL